MGMMRYVCYLLVLFTLALPFAARAQEASLDNLPLPRWAVLSANEINLRTGPGKRYPIDWVLKKKGLPVEIRQEFDSWRLVHEPGGAEGWVHRSMLSSTRNVLIQSKDQPIYANPSTDARVTARLQQGVVATARICQVEWCHLQVQDYKGWIPKAALWGVYPKEIFE